jgi:hypothetical protein
MGNEFENNWEDRGIIGCFYKYVSLPLAVRRLIETVTTSIFGNYLKQSNLWKNVP